jgi:predicted alpha/beta hydrolase family esterase
MTDDEFTIHRLGARQASHDGPPGPLVVLVHGMEDTWPSWRPFAAGLLPSWRVYALDPPWRAGNAYTWRRRATAGGWVAAALARLDEPVDLLVGHSLGANSVLEVLAMPGSAGVRAAALLAPFYRARATQLTWELFDQARKNFDRLIADGMRMRLGPRFIRLDADLREAMLDKMIDRIGPQGFIAWFDHFAASSDLGLAGVTTPTLVLASVDDPCLANGRAEALASDMPAATMWLDSTYDHFCHVRQARQTAAQLVRFASTAVSSPPSPRTGKDIP